MNKMQNNKSKEMKLGYFQKEGNAATIYIGNLKFDKTEYQIKEIFEKYGQVKYVKVVTDNKTGKSKGIAFIQMPNKLEAKKAIKELNGKVIDGRTVKVSVAVERESDKRIQKQKITKLSEPLQSESEDSIKPKKKKKRVKGLALLFQNTKK